VAGLVAYSNPSPQNGMAHEYTTYLSGVVLPSCEIQGFKLRFWKTSPAESNETTSRLHWQMFDQKLILVGFVTGRGIVSGSFIWQLPLSISSISCIIHGCAGVVRWCEAGEGMVMVLTCVSKMISTNYRNSCFCSLLFYFILNLHNW